MDLEFYTNEELIEELVKRTNFLGTIIFSEKEYLNNDWGKEKRNFKVKFNTNLTNKQVGKLLEHIAQHITENPQD